MNDLGKLFFLHFEKALVGVFGAALLYSLIFYGPWFGAPDFQRNLADIARQVESKTERGEEAVPAVPDLTSQLALQRALPAGRVLEKAWVWDPPAREGNLDILPPTGVTADSSRGYVKVNWEINPNQTESDAMVPLGVQVERAIVAAQGQGPWESLTSSDDAAFHTPLQVFTRAQRYVPAVVEQERARRATGPTVRSLYTERDILNAVIAGRLTLDQARNQVRSDVRRGVLGAEMQMRFDDAVMEIGATVMAVRDEFRGTGQRPNPVEMQRMAMQELGYTGESNWGVVATAAPAAVQPGNAPGQVVRVVEVAFEEINSFIDPDVSPDQDYVYRVRFWVADATSPNRDRAASGWSEQTRVVSARPDTEFYLLGVSAESGVASIRVRKWVPTTNRWSTRDYRVAPGEQIGRRELVPMVDAAGRPLMDASRNRRMEEVDFSTDCVLLGFRYQLRAFDKVTRITEIDPNTLIKQEIDKVEQLLYDTPQIVYSDRKGQLRLKWQTLADVT